MANDLSFFARTNLPDCNGRPTCTSPPVCPACGGLECLCRPRFFAGQLLTEEDLNRLDYYIVAKNRLHNRYLVGWGVACGLEVVCNVCGPDQASGGVLVKPGYALSPCGNDIVLCKAEPVDVCALINACRPPHDDCYDLFTPPQATQPPAGTPGAVIGGGAKPDCDGGTDDWVLAVCYSEKPARGVTALLRAASTPANCKCGGNCGCGGQCRCGNTASAYTRTAGTDCGCGNGKPPAPNPNLASALPEQCEPTLTCEGYRFVAYKAPTKDPYTRQYGAAAKRFLCCILPLFEELGSSAASGQKTPQQAIDWVYSLRDAVRDFILNQGFYDCRIAAKLNAVAIPSSSGAGQVDKLFSDLTVAAYGVLNVGLLVLQKCLCAALLPPCPDPSQLDCVPLATVTVARGHCRVLKVCNLSARKFLVTIPNIEYWLSMFSLFTGGKGGINSFRQVLEALCCTPLEGRYTGDAVAAVDLFHFQHAVAPAQPANAGAMDAVQPALEGGPLAGNGSHAFGNLLWSALASPDRKVTVENLLLAAFDARDADGKPFASAEELAHPTEFVMLNQVVAPVLRQFARGDANGGLAGIAAAGTRLDSARTDELARQIAVLRTTVAKQDKAIAALKKRIG
jgi:hypothetical protein